MLFLDKSKFLAHMRSPVGEKPQHYSYSVITISHNHTEYITFYFMLQYHNHKMTTIFKIPGIGGVYRGQIQIQIHCTHADSF